MRSGKASSKKHKENDGDHCSLNAQCNGKEYSLSKNRFDVCMNWVLWVNLVSRSLTAALLLSRIATMQRLRTVQGVTVPSDSLPQGLEQDSFHPSFWRVMACSVPAVHCSPSLLQKGRVCEFPHPPTPLSEHLHPPAILLAPYTPQRPPILFRSYSSHHPIPFSLDREWSTE